MGQRHEEMKGHETKGQRYETKLILLICSEVSFLSVFLSHFTLYGETFSRLCIQPLYNVSASNHYTRERKRNLCSICNNKVLRASYV